MLTSFGACSSVEEKAAAVIRSNRLQSKSFGAIATLQWRSSNVLVFLLTQIIFYHYGKDPYRSLLFVILFAEVLLKLKSRDCNEQMEISYNDATTRFKSETSP